MIDSFKKNLGLHFFYIIVFLVVLLIFVATGQWTDKDNFTSYLSNVATFTSLVLGLVAIFYSFIANDSIGKNLGGVSESTNKLNDISVKIESSFESIESAKISSEQIKSKVSSLVDDLSLKINHLDESICEIKSYKEVLSGSIDQGFTSLHDRIKSLVQEDYMAVKNDKLNINESVGFSYLLSMYLIAFCCENRKIIKPYQIYSTEEESLYLHGILNTLKFF